MGWMVASARAWGWRFMWIRPRRAITQASWRTPLASGRSSWAGVASIGGRPAAVVPNDVVVTVMTPPRRSRPGRGLVVVVGGGPGEGEEHLVEGGLAQAEVVDPDPGPEQALGDQDHRLHAPAGGAGDGAGGGVDHDVEAGDVVDDAGRLGQPVGVGHHHPHLVAADGALEGAGVAPGDDLAVVDDDDVVGQALGLVEVLGGEHDGGAPVDEGVDHGPQLGPGPGVEAGGGLVEEEHAGAGHEGGGQVEPAPHAARVAGDDPVGGLGEGEVVEQDRGPLGRLLAAELVQLAQHDQVLPAGEEGVDGGVLGGQADPAADLVGLAADVEAGHGGGALVGLGEGGEDAHGGGLARPVGPEDGGDGADRDLQVDAVEGDGVAVALDQAVGVDRVGDVGRRCRLAGAPLDQSGVVLRHGDVPSRIGLGSDGHHIS